jgi:cytochrome c-type biogenesis protein CcmH
LSAPLIAAALAFAMSLGLALWLARRGRERAAFAAVVAAPLVAALGFVAVTALPQRATAAAMAAAPEATPPATPPAAPAADGLRRQAEALRRDKRYPEARDAYAKLVQDTPDDVDAWADLADAQAAAAGGDLKASGAAIDRALAIDPNHLKALWLKASLELQERRLQSAARLWERLLAQLPPDSNDARIVRANLEETRALASQQGAAR